MAFGLTPAGSGFPPQAPDAFPNYIQFQSSGTDLGLPNVDTVDFTTGLTATRGTGENANKVTLSASGGAATLEELAVSPRRAPCPARLMVWCSTTGPAPC